MIKIIFSRKISFTLLLLAFSGSLFAQTNTVICSFSHKAGNTPLVLDQTEFTIWNGKTMKLSRAEFYLSQPILHLPDSTSVQLAEQFMLVSAKAPAAEFNLGSWPAETVQGVTLHIGIDSSHNHLDPASYPVEHPLAPKNPSMHWGWVAGYNFLALQGYIDNNNDGVCESWFEFHTLGDSLFKTVELSGTPAAQNDTLRLHFDLDYARLFQDMSMTGDLIEHGSKGPCIELMHNSATQGFIAMTPVLLDQTILNYSQYISAAPNPAGDNTLIRYELPVSGAVNLAVTNALGQTVYTGAGLPAAGAVQLETAGWPQGIYQYAFYEKGWLLARRQLAVVH